MSGPDAKLVNSHIPKLVDARAMADSIVSQVQAKLPRGAANKPGSSPASIACLDRMRTVTTPKLMVPGAFYMLVSDIRTIADDALSRGCGNCGEQAAIAFMMLVDKRVEPIDYVFCAGEGDDHAFVVIGRREGSDVRKYSAQTWGPDAVVCDPWMGKAYPCGEMQTNLAPRTKTFEYGSKCRFRTVDGHTPL
ncbi:MAG: hypothetical protein ACHQM4_06895 [Thermoanaerobaculia bacterium]